MTPEEFRRACGHWASGVSIITTRDLDGKPYGLTMNAVTSLSLDPPLFLICVDNNSDTLARLKRSGIFCINILQRDQQSLARTFAAKGADKFGEVAFEWGRSGSPLLVGRLLAIECRIDAVYPGGDHHIVVGAVTAIDSPAADAAAPLLYYRGRYAHLVL